MIHHVLIRAGFHASLLVGVILATFVLFQLVPNDPARTILGPNASESQVESFRFELGLDRPAPARAWGFVRRAVRLDFGRSFVDNRLVAPEVRSRLAVSATLVALALLLTGFYVVGILLLEQLAHVRVGTATDFLLVSTPTLFSGVVVALLAGRYWPFAAYAGRLTSIDDWLALMPAALALAFYPMAILSRVLRGEFDRLERAPFIVAARAQGFSELRLLATFTLKNASIPIVASLSTLVPTLFTGAFVVEVIFSIPATGTLLARSVLQRDLPMLEGLVISSALLAVSCHLLVEIAGAMLDPQMAQRHA